MDELTSMNTLLVAILIVLVIILLVELLQLIRAGKGGVKDTISLEKYYELKFRINLFLSIAAVVTGVGGYLGFSYRNIVTQQIATMTDSLAVVDSRLQKVLASIDSAEINAVSIKQKFSTFDSRINQTNQEIGRLQQANLKQWEFHLVKDIEVNMPSGFSSGVKIKIYFKDLTLLDGRKLGVLRNPPIVNVIQNEKTRGGVSIAKVTNEYFELRQFPIANNPGIPKLDVWIAVL